jgi:hypothetical protein
MRSTYGALIALASLLGGEVCDAQRQPASIPTVVAESMTLYFGTSMFGMPSYTVNAAPPGWPKELIPAKARLIGGSMLGSVEEFRIRTLVVEMPAGPDPLAVIRAMADKAGYSIRAPADSSQGGFVESSGVSRQMPLCKGKISSLAFAALDSISAPRVIALQFYDGEVARQQCDAVERYRARFGSRERFGPKNMPSLVAPGGVSSTGGSSSWGGLSGTMTSILLTTMPSDSIIAHYARQLVAAGWTPDGAALANRVVGLQKFRFTDGGEPWSALVMVEAVGNRRDVTLRLAMVNGEP